MSKLKDLTGQHFGKLKVIERTESHISPSGYKKGVLSRRIFSGWSIEDAFTKPVKSNSKKGDVVNE